MGETHVLTDFNMLDRIPCSLDRLVHPGDKMCGLKDCIIVCRLMSVIIKIIFISFLQIQTVNVNYVKITNKTAYCSTNVSFSMANADI